MIRSKLWYCLLLVFFFVFSILYNNYITFLLFLMLLIVPFIMWIQFLYIRRCVDIHLEVAETVHTRGIPYNIVIRLSNQSIFPIPMIKIKIQFHNRFLPEDKTETILTSIDAKNETLLTVSAYSRYCGLCEYHLKKAVIYDYLSIFQFRKKCRQEVSVAILPNLNIIEEQVLPNNSAVLVESELFSNVKSGDDPSELFGIRAYEQGDKMNRIHWKLSIKQGELMIKQFGLPINCAVAILADFYTGEQEISLEQIDGIIESLLTLSLSLVSQEQIHFIVWYDIAKEDCVRYRIEKEEDCYEAISRIYHCKITEFANDLALYHEAQFPNEQYTNIIYLTAYLTEDVISHINDLQKFAITNLFYISNTGLEQDMLIYSESMRIRLGAVRVNHILEDLISER